MKAKPKKKNLAGKKKTKAQTNLDALLKATWKLHRSSGHKFTMKKLEEARELLWGKG